jgi:hypothetical protein
MLWRISVSLHGCVSDYNPCEILMVFLMRWLLKLGRGPQNYSQNLKLKGLFDSIFNDYWMNDLSDWLFVVPKFFM